MQLRGYAFGSSDYCDMLNIHVSYTHVTWVCSYSLKLWVVQSVDTNVKDRRHNSNGLTFFFFLFCIFL